MNKNKESIIHKNYYIYKKLGKKLGKKLVKKIVN